MTYDQLWRSLTPLYEAGEAKAIVRLLMKELFDFSLTDLCCGAVERLSAEQLQRLHRAHQRLLDAEPIQYVLGNATFCDRSFKVNPSVLIPRPETEELCQWVIEEEKKKRQTRSSSPQLLDLCTGSGCIAITLALELPDYEVTAWDVSIPALNTAKENARQLHAPVRFERQDVLKLCSAPAQWQIMVSNPPYICENERSTMAPNVLRHEPELALFVPDDDPMRFYRAISNYAQWALLPGGQLFFEFNPRYEDFLWETLAGLGFSDIRLKDDAFGHTRFMTATR